MDKGWFTSLFNRFLAHPRLTAAGVALLVLLSAAGLFFIPFKHSMDVMLPADSETSRAVGYLQDIDFSAKVALSFSLNDETVERAEWFAAVDVFADALEPPMITKVLSSFDQEQMIRDVGIFLQRAPELIGEQELELLEEKTTRAGVKKVLREKYVQLLKPEGSFMVPMIQRDPLDIQMTMIEKLSALSSSFGYDMNVENGHLVSTDGTLILLVLETDIPFTDASGSHDLVNYLNEKRAELPDFIDSEMVCGHLHTISNERVIKHDVQLTVTLATIAFVLLFLLFFKDLRANYIFIIPFVALLVAVNVAAFFLRSMSPMMLGFGSVVSGIAVDYGIHVYVALKRSSSKLEAVRAVAKPVVLGALTTAGVFVAFYFSSIPGYKQLATFALLSVVFSVFGALFILPVYLKAGTAKVNEERVAVRSDMSRGRCVLILGIFLVVLAAAIPVGMQVDFNTDIMALDGTEQAIVETEERFQKSFGGGSADQSVAMVAGEDPEEALQLNDQLFSAFSASFDSSKIASLSPIWKSYRERKANAERWNTFWGDERRDELKRLFNEEGETFGFTADAFDPFFDSLQGIEVRVEAPQENELFDQLQKRFVANVDGQTRVFSFFPDEPEMIALMKELKSSIAGLVVISRSAIASSLAEDYTREFSRITLVACGLVLLMSFILLRSVKKVLIVLSPAVAGVASVAALAKLIGSDLNVMNLVSGIIVIGLCVDYGIFRVHAYTHSLDLGTKTAISLSAGTTLIGSGALLFTYHPALFAVGLTLVGGISAGYLTSLFVVPALCSLLLKEERV